jgi:hypothetical protein
MSLVLQTLHFLAGFVVLAEALNKVERVDLFDGRRGWLARVDGIAWLAVPWHWKRDHVLKALKALAWALLAIGAASAIATPLMHLARPTLQDVAVLGGMAVLIVRSRIKEGWPA